jgi:hypothetical protein
LVLCLVACSRSGDGPESDLADYVTRIARVVQGQPSALTLDPLPAYPDRREILLAIPNADIDVAQFVELHECDLGALVGYRNSPLGRVQRASQRLGYEMAWLGGARRCADPPPWLIQLADEKVAQLPALFWNATFAAPELRVALGRSGPRNDADLAYLLRTLGDALSGLERGGFDGVAFEATLGQLRAGSWVGYAREDWALGRHYLQAAEMLLNEARPRLCLNGRPTPRSRRLLNIFRRYYVGGIQPALAAALSRQEPWVRQLQALVRALDEVIPTPFASWYRQTLDPRAVGSEWSRTRRAIVTHAASWQRMFESCGIELKSALGEY